MFCVTGSDVLIGLLGNHAGLYRTLVQLVSGLKLRTSKCSTRSRSQHWSRSKQMNKSSHIYSCWRKTQRCSDHQKEFSWGQRWVSRRFRVSSSCAGSSRVMLEAQKAWGVFWECSVFGFVFKPTGSAVPSPSDFHPNFHPEATKIPHLYLFLWWNWWC